MSIITVADITTYMDISLTNTQEDAAELIIEGLQAELEAYLRRPVVPTSFTETYRLPDTFGVVANEHYYQTTYTDAALMSTSIRYTPVYTIYLKNSPVVSIEELTLTPPSTGASAVVLEEHNNYVVREYGVDIVGSTANSLATVEYTAGLDGENIKIFKLLMLRAATREMQNMHDDVVGLKDLTTRNVAPLETGFTERELFSLKRYRRVRVS